MQAELVERARRGDREAFGVLAGGAVDRLYAVARLILRDTELAEDATQDALAAIQLRPEDAVDIAPSASSS